MTTLNDLLAVNGQGDEQEPWCAADRCECIDIRGEDILALCQDGVARWSNRDRSWYEVEMEVFARTIDEIDSLEDAARFADWMERFWA